MNAMMRTAFHIVILFVLVFLCSCPNPLTRPNTTATDADLAAARDSVV